MTDERVMTGFVFAAKAVLVFAILGGIVWVVHTYLSRVQTNGPVVTESDCRKDLKILNASIDRLIELGEISAKMHYTNAQIHSLVMAESFSIKNNSIPIYKIGDCGAKASLAFNAFTSAFAYGLGMENESDYSARPEHEKQKLKAYAMEQLTKSREDLDLERRLLQKAAEGR